MKKLFVIFISLLICFIQDVKSNTEGTKCAVTHKSTIGDEWKDLPQSSCYDLLIAQIEMEMQASMTYLSIASYFSRDNVNLPGFAKFFFESANEEREHAIKLLEYADIRGQPDASKLNNLLDFNKIIQNTPHIEFDQDLSKAYSGKKALTDALKKEVAVTASIKEIIKKCESPVNDYHLVDYLTGEFLDEQYKGQRKIVGMISTLEKMDSKHGTLGEFLFDKKLLNGELF